MEQAVENLCVLIGVGVITTVVGGAVVLTAEALLAAVLKKFHEIVRL